MSQKTNQIFFLVMTETLESLAARSQIFLTQTVRDLRVRPNALRETVCPAGF